MRAAAGPCRQVISVAQVRQPLNLFLKAAFNGYSYGEGCEPKCIGDNYGAYQYLNNKIQRAIYVWFFMPQRMEGDGGYIHPLPLQILVAGEGAAGGRAVLCGCVAAARAASLTACATPRALARR